MEKRAILAVALSFLVFFAYTKIVQVFYPEYGEPKVATEQSLHIPPATRSIDQSNASLDQNLPPANVPRLIEEDVVVEEQMMEWAKEPYAFEFSKQYGSITEASFPEYFDSERNEPLKFLQTNGSKGIGAMRVWLNDSPWSSTTEEALTNQNGLKSVVSNDSLEIIKEFDFSKSNYGNVLRVSIRNKTSIPQKLQFDLSAGAGVVAHRGIDQQYIEANWIDVESVKHVKKAKENEPNISEKSYIATSLKSRHFSSILKPLGENQYLSQVSKINKKEIASSLISPAISIAPNGAWEEEYFFYLGPNGIGDLEPYDLGQVVHFGKLDPICKVLIGIMQLIHGVVKNYGLSIIILTIFINLLLMPLTKTSFMSMRRMQLVQPEMAKLRTKYKDNAQKLNTEMMALYKKHKVNPMGGCLPMVLQMPVFISLYVALSKSSELLGARFLWITDLASPDNVPLPFTVPYLGNTIHILPLIMMVAMVAQQKLTMSGMTNADPNMAKQQKMMMTFMPIFFGFLFYPMPSGLVIYWLTNTVVMGSYQYYLRRGNVTPAVKTIR